MKNLKREGLFFSDIKTEYTYPDTFNDILYNLYIYITEYGEEYAYMKRKDVYYMLFCFVEACNNKVFNIQKIFSKSKLEIKPNVSDTYRMIKILKEKNIFINKKLSKEYKLMTNMNDGNFNYCNQLEIKQNKFDEILDKMEIELIEECLKVAKEKKEKEENEMRIKKENEERIKNEMIEIKKEKFRIEKEKKEEEIKRLMLEIRKMEQEEKELENENEKGKEIKENQFKFSDEILNTVDPPGEIIMISKGFKTKRKDKKLIKIKKENDKIDNLTIKDLKKKKEFKKIYYFFREFFIHEDWEYNRETIIQMYKKRPFELRRFMTSFRNEIKTVVKREKHFEDVEFVFDYYIDRVLNLKLKKCCICDEKSVMEDIIPSNMFNFKVKNLDILESKRITLLIANGFKNNTKNRKNKSKRYKKNSIILSKIFPNEYKKHLTTIYIEKMLINKNKEKTKKKRKKRKENEKKKKEKERENKQGENLVILNVDSGNNFIKEK